MAYTIKDIAALAGVSIGTVSRILNGKTGVKPATREKVLAVAKQLNYSPNHIAKSMKTNKTFTIGLIVADITNPYYSYSAKIIEMRAREHNYTVIVGNTNNNSNLQEDIIDNLKERKVDGFIFASVGLRDKAVKDLINAGQPCVMYNRHLLDYYGNFIGCDDAKGVRMVLDHLISFGHQKIAFISGPRKYSTGMERLKAFLNISKEMNIETPSYYFSEGGYDKTITAASVEELLDLPEPPTAIFAANDFMALQVLDTVLKKGYKVPQDISIVGFDDIDIASHNSIQLTTVNVQMKRCAQLVIEKVINIIEGVQPASKTEKLLLEPTLMVRRSTTAPRKHNLK